MKELKQLKKYLGVISYEDRMFSRQGLFGYLSTIDYTNIKDTNVLTAVCDIIVEIFLLDFPNMWTDFSNNLHELTTISSKHSRVVLSILNKIFFALTPTTPTGSPLPTSSLTSKGNKIKDALVNEINISALVQIFIKIIQYDTPLLTSTMTQTLCIYTEWLGSAVITQTQLGILFLQVYSRGIS